jgi:hypothetical protein
VTEPAETLAALWRLSRAEARELDDRVAMLERAVVRAMAGAPVAGDGSAWTDALADAEAATEAARARTARIASLIAGRAA